MEHVKYLILGAGPAGLTFARNLLDQNEDSFLVIEQEKTAGGLCRSKEVDGAPFDIGGGHFLDVKRPKVNEFLFRFMPKEEWSLFERDSRIWVKGMTINHPFESNIWQMDMDRQIEYLVSISRAGCNNGEPMPEKFIDWIQWKLGDKIAQDYMIPYNQKMFADELNLLGTFWLEKLPNVSFEETLRSCLTHRAYGTQPGHAFFYYPKKYGYGEVWLRIADSMAEHMVYEQTVDEIDFNKRMVSTKSGAKWEADVIVTTIPWTCVDKLTGMPEQMRSSLRKELKHSSIETRYVPEKLDTEAQWIYVPEKEKPFHRILVRHNFCKNSNGYWLETRKERTKDYTEDACYHYMNEYAYPLNTVGKPEVIQKILNFGRERNVYGLGRWGEHSHYNSDLIVEMAMNMAEKIVK
ncbi:MAG: NAD(P)-binding protein [Lachnospiraceae bacterium]|nr:NAD(P)-binding protein [Lachnospiraceae bacterium]